MEYLQRVQELVISEMASPSALTVQQAGALRDYL
jgi:hypothetical protein